MDKIKAIERLDALDREARELRRMIERTDKLIYNSNNMYIALIGSSAYILAGCSSEKYYRWHSFPGFNTVEQGWGPPRRSGQDALDEGQGDGEVHVFTDAREGFKFFLEHHKG